MADPTPHAEQLARLPAVGFVPPAPATPAGDQAAEFTAAVERFAATFWELAPAERRACWTTLRARNDGPAVAWLVGLESGLDVTPRPQRDRYAAELGRVIRELFALPPAARAARRREWLTTAATPFGVWAVAAKELAADRPTAALDPLLMHRLRNVYVPTPIAPADLGGGDDPLAGTVWLAEHEAEAKRAASPKATETALGGFVALVVAAFLGMLISGLKTGSEAPRPVQFPSPVPVLTSQEQKDLLRSLQTTSTTFRALSGWTTSTRPARPTRR